MLAPGSSTIAVVKVMDGFRVPLLVTAAGTPQYSWPDVILVRLMPDGVLVEVKAYSKYVLATVGKQMGMPDSVSDCVVM